MNGKIFIMNNNNKNDNNKKLRILWSFSEWLRDIIVKKKLWTLPFPYERVYQEFYALSTTLRYHPLVQLVLALHHQLLHFLLHWIRSHFLLAPMYWANVHDTASNHMHQNSEKFNFFSWTIDCAIEFLFNIRSYLLVFCLTQINFIHNFVDSETIFDQLWFCIRLSRSSFGHFYST